METPPTSPAITWWHCGLLGAGVLTLATLIGAPLKLLARWWLDEPIGPLTLEAFQDFRLSLFVMGFVSGVAVWAGSGLPRRFGPPGDALLGIIGMTTFFLCCMVIFSPAMLTRPSWNSTGVMLGLAAAAGAWIGWSVGRDLRRPSP